MCMATFYIGTGSVPEVPEGNSLVSAARGQDKLAVGIEAQAVDL